MEKKIWEKLKDMDKKYIHEFKEMSKKLEKIDERLDQHDGQLEFLAEKSFDHETRLDNVTRILSQHTVRLDRIEEKLENTATKDDMNRIIGTLDVLVGYAKKHEQELVFMGHRLSRVEKDVSQIKPLVGLI